MRCRAVRRRHERRSGAISRTVAYSAPGVWGSRRGPNRQRRSPYEKPMRIGIMLATELAAAPIFNPSPERPRQRIASLIAERRELVGLLGIGSHAKVGDLGYSLPARLRLRSRV